MMMFTPSGLFASAASFTQNRRASKPRRKRPFAARMRVEALEDRVVPATFTVNTLADTVDTDSAVTSLHDAITAANSQAGDDIIDFSVTGTINLTRALPDLSSNIQIQGPGADSLTVRRDTVLPGEGRWFRIFTVAGGPTIVLDGLTISNGFEPADYGGGIYNSGTLTVSNSAVSGNFGATGGGIYNAGTLTVSNSTLLANSCYGFGGGIFNANYAALTVSKSTLSGNSTPNSNGGGIFNANYAALTVSNSTLSGNSARAGGGIDNYCTLTLNNSTLSSNHGDGGSGGINNASGSLTVSNSTLSGNSTSGGSGGGIANYNGALTVSNSTLSGNATTGGSQNGGGIYQDGGTLTVSSSTLSSNHAGEGGGIFINGGTVTVSNSTLSDNSAYVDVGGGISNYIDGNTLTLSNSIVANNLASFGNADVYGSFTGSNNLFGSVPLGPLQNNGGPTQTYALPADSPAIDAGNNSLVPAGATTNQRGPGFPRVFNGTVDIGAFEVQPLGYATSAVLTSAANPTQNGQPVTLTTTVSSSAATPTGIVEYLDSGVLLSSALLVDGVAQFAFSSLTAGNHAISAHYGGDLVFAGSNALLIQAVNKADQTITFGSLADGSYNGVPFIPSVTASSGLPVSLAVISGPATLAGRTITINGTGTVVIEATVAGNDNFNAALVNHSFTVNHLTRTGSLDPTFGNGGKQIINNFDSALNYTGDPSAFSFDRPSNPAITVTVLPDGSIHVVGDVGFTQGIPFGIEQTLTPDGEIGGSDLYGHDSGSLPPFPTPTSSAEQADGKTLEVGTSNGDFLVQRFNTDGSLDTSFGNGGAETIDYGSTDYATSVAVQPDGKIVVVGYSFIRNSQGIDYSFTVARLEGYDPAVVGTEGDDSISIAPGTQAGTLKVTVNGLVTDDMAASGLMLVEGLGGNDTFTVTAALAQGLILSGEAGSDIYDVSFGNLAGSVTVADNGASGTDQFTARGTAGDDSIFKDDTKVTLGNPVQQTILYSGIESLIVHGGAGNDTIIDPGSNTQIFGDAGNDTIVVSATSSSGVFVDGGAGSDTYVIGGGILAGPVTVADSGTSGTDSIQVVDTLGDDVLAQTASGFLLNGTAINVTGLEAASVDGGGGAGDTFSVQGTPPVPTTVQGVSDAIITGTAGNDVIRISATNNAGEVKVRLNGALVGTFRPTGQLTVYGLAGDDDIQVDSAITLPALLDGSDGNDILTGGGGNDSITDLSGNNQIHAGRGDDTVTVGDGNNQIWTDDGVDSVTAGGGSNEIHAGKGNNVILVGSGNNSVWTSGGIDSLTTGDGANQIHAVGDSDAIVLGNGNNRIWGEGGADFISAGDGNNVISGGSGDDTITVGNGNNTISGGTGNDVITTGNGNNSVDAGAGDDDVKTGSGNDVIDGGSGDDVILGGAGDDTITGGAGNDILVGGVGKDRISGGAGNDILVAGDVDSSLDVPALRAISQAWAAAHTVADAAVDDFLDETYGDGNSDALTGGAGADPFIINSGDTITDFQFGKPKANKDGDVVIKDGVVTT